MSHKQSCCCWFQAQKSWKKQQTSLIMRVIHRVPGISVLIERFELFHRSIPTSVPSVSCGMLRMSSPAAHQLHTTELASLQLKVRLVRILLQTFRTKTANSSN